MKKSKMPLIAGIGVVVLAGIIALVLMLNRKTPPVKPAEGPVALQGPGGGAPAPDVAAKTPEPEVVAKAPKQEAAEKVHLPDLDRIGVGQAKPGSEDAPAKKGSPEEAAAGKTDPAGSKAPAPADATPKKADTGATPGKKKTAVQPFNAKTQLEPVPFPEDVPAEKQAEYKALAEKAIGDGMPAKKAQTALEKAGRHGMPALINALRELDYGNAEQVITGFVINKALERMTKGVNARYRNVGIEEKPDQDDIYWNNRVVGTWQEFYKANGKSDEIWSKMLVRNANREKIPGEEGEDK